MSLTSSPTLKIQKSDFLEYCRDPSNIPSSEYQIRIYEKKEINEKCIRRFINVNKPMILFNGLSVTPLCYAIINKNLRLVKFIIEQCGGRPNIICKINGHRFSLLYYAILINCHIEIIQYLLNNEHIDANTGDLISGETPLIACVKKTREKRKWKQIINSLLNLTDLNKHDFKGLTALHHAVYCGNWDCVTLLVKNKCYYSTLFIEVGYQCNFHNMKRDKQYFFFLDLILIFLQNKNNSTILDLNCFLNGFYLLNMSIQNEVLRISCLEQISLMITKIISCLEETSKVEESLPLVSYNYDYHNRLLSIIGDNEETGNVKRQIEKVFLCETCSFLSTKYQYSALFIHHVLYLCHLYYKENEKLKTFELLFFLLDICSLKEENINWMIKVIRAIVSKSKDNPEFNCHYKLLCYLNEKFKLDDVFLKKISERKYNFLVFVYIYLIYEQIDTLKCDTQMQKDIEKHAYNLRLRNYNMDTLLHAIVSRKWENSNDFATYPFKKFNEDCTIDENIYALIKFFIVNCNVSVNNCFNIFRENILHYTVVEQKSNFLTITLLNEFNVHADIASRKYIAWCTECNYDNNNTPMKTVIDVFESGGCYHFQIDEYFTEETCVAVNNCKLRLKGIVSRFIRNNDIYYLNQIPKTLEVYVDKH